MQWAFVSGYTPSNLSQLATKTTPTPLRYIALKWSRWCVRRYIHVVGVLTGIFAVWRCLKVRRRQARMRARCIQHLPMHALARDVRTHACTGSGGGGGGG
jgi:hypothetical protein